MNERIRELAEQCYHRYSEHHIDLQKFAELIVKETLEVARAGVEFGDGMESAVEQYFGVKL